MYEALVARVRYHIQKAEFMGLKEAESTLLLAGAADAIEKLSTIRDEQKAQIILMAAEIEEQQPRWIPATERLPEKPGEYNVYLRCGIELQDPEFGCDLSYVTTCHFDPDQCLWDDGACRYNGFLEHVNKQRTYYITHWMPLPKGPEEE